MMPCGSGWQLTSRVVHADADLRGKELVMRLMMHPDAEVQKQALLAVQKILLAKDKVDFLHGTT